MAYFCVVPGCPMRKVDKQPGISFHGIPVKEKQQKMWLEILSKHIPDGQTLILKDNSGVCSLHFTPLDYRKDTKKRCLIPTAVPSIFPRCPSTLELGKRVRTSKMKLAIIPTGQPIPQLLTKPLVPESKPSLDYAPFDDSKCMDCDIEEFPQLRNVGVQVASLQTGLLEELRKENYRLKSKHNKLKDHLKAANEKVALSERKLTGFPEFHKLQRIKKLKNNVKGSILVEQVNNFEKQNPRWSDLTLNECVEWRNMDHKSYDHARKGLITLPSRSTVFSHWKLTSPEFICDDNAIIIKDKVRNMTPKSLNIPCSTSGALPNTHAVVIDCINEPILQPMQTSECLNEIADTSIDIIYIEMGPSFV